MIIDEFLYLFHKAKRRLCTVLRLYQYSQWFARVYRLNALLSSHVVHEQRLLEHLKVEKVKKLNLLLKLEMDRVYVSRTLVECTVQLNWSVQHVLADLRTVVIDNTRLHFILRIEWLCVWVLLLSRVSQLCLFEDCVIDRYLELSLLRSLLDQMAQIRFDGTVVSLFAGQEEVVAFWFGLRLFRLIVIFVGVREFMVFLDLQSYLAHLQLTVDVELRLVFIEYLLHLVELLVEVGD